MKRFELTIDGRHEGIIEALSQSEALTTAYRDYPILSDPRRWIKLTREDRAMHILIDTTNWRAIARHDSHKALAALALIQFANIDCRILRLHENKSWTVFSKEHLRAIGESMGVLPASDAPYPEVIKAIRLAAESIDWLALPFTTGDLQAQAYAVDPDDARPLGFDPKGTEPKLLKKWPCDPQRPSKRRDSSFWTTFAAGLGHGPGIVTAETASYLDGSAPAAPSAPSAPERPRKTPSAPKEAPSAPRAPRAIQAASARPKAGTSTGRVWELADAVKARMPISDWKAFRAEVTKLGEAEGINPGTVGVQLSKWKASTQI